MFTRNFYRVLQHIFNRGGINAVMPKSWSGTEGYTLNTDTANGLGKMIFSTGTQSPTPNLVGIEDNLDDEEAFNTTNSFKYSGQGTGELNAHYTNNREHCVVFMVVGSGTTAPTKDDYKLENFIGSDVLQATFCANSADTSLTGDTLNVITRAWTFQNVSASPVTVNEIGMIGRYVADYSIRGNWLMCREVLASPVTIQPGETYTFEVNLTAK